MSEYGRLWQHCAERRQELREEFKRLTGIEPPIEATATLEAAGRAVQEVMDQQQQALARQERRFERILKEWEQLEERMAQEPER